MSTPQMALIAVACSAVSLAVVWLVMKNAQRLALVQAPNQRSSHHVPTATGGGAGIVVGTACVAAFPGGLTAQTPVILALGIAMAALGLSDDRRALSAKFRLAIQAVIIVVLIWQLQIAAPLAQLLGLPLVLVTLAVIALASLWWTNLFNFMDGIDGFAATQAIFMIGAAVALGGTALDIGLVALSIGLGAACMGFLVFNWPPAKIFMGDAGSLFLGFVLLAISLSSMKSGALMLEQWLIIASLFVVDASVTLAVRTGHRRNIFSGHRSHAYQILARRWQSHGRVTVAYCAVNVLVAFPLAWAVGHWPEYSILGVVLFYFIIVGAVLCVGAGRPQYE